MVNSVIEIQIKFSSAILRLTGSDLSEKKLIKGFLYKKYYLKVDHLCFSATIGDLFSFGATDVIFFIFYTVCPRRLDPFYILS